MTGDSIISVEKLGNKYSLHHGNWLPVGAAAFSLALLIAMVAWSPAHLCFDEIEHLPVTQLVKQIGWRAAITSPENHSAAGPLYPALHLAVSPLTRLHAPAVRWVNLACLITIFMVIAIQLKAVSVVEKLSAMTLLSVPFLWPPAGMALTELPALLFFTIFVAIFAEIIKRETSREDIVLAVLAGLSLGVAILGRQTYLVTMPVIALMAIWLPNKWPLLLACLSSALLADGWLFWLWGGLAPAYYTRFSHSLFSLKNGMLSLGYAAGATLFMSPRWMMRPSPGLWLWGGVCGIGLAFIAREYENPPAKTLLVRMLGLHVAMLAGFVVGCALSIAGVIWAWNIIYRAWKSRRDPERLFFLLTLVALVLAPIGMPALFSSRYVVGLLGVLLVVIGLPREMRGWWAARTLVGSLIGAAMLWTYFY